MMLSHVSREDALRRLAESTSGAPDSLEAICDFLRAEVHARKHAPRAATLWRVARLLEPAISIGEGRFEEACDALEREGDVMLNPGGTLHATPTRVVAVEGRARVFSSVPTSALSKALGRKVAARGATRTVYSLDRLSEAVETMSGAMIPPHAWAGLDHSPNADAAFVARLDQRLEWEAVAAGSLKADGELEWRAWQVMSEVAHWRRSTAGRLWWARTRFGGHHRAWTAGTSPATGAFITLSSDDADRARFALSREVAEASLLRIKRSGMRAMLELPGWLPRPEYRWLSLQGEMVAESKGIRWEVSADAVDEISRVLAERLGLIVRNS